MTLPTRSTIAPIVFALLMVTSVATVGGLAQPIDDRDTGDPVTVERSISHPVPDSALRAALAQQSSSVTISGSATFADGSAVDGWKVIAGSDDLVTSTFTSGGDYALDVEPEATYNVFYQQYNGNQSESFPRDGRPDIHAIDEVDVGSSNVTVPERQFPQAFVLNVTVVDETGSPVENADLHVTQLGPEARAHGDPSTDANGMAQWEGNEKVGLELRGEVQIWAEGPPGLGTNFTELTVDRDRSATLTLPSTVNVTGQVLHSDGTPAAENQVFFDGIEEAGTNDWQGTRTDTNGNFSVELNEDGTYDMGYQQRDFHNDSATVWPTDGAPDIQALGRIHLGTSDVDLGTHTLSAAHTLNVSVVDANGTPIENAEVNIGSRNGSASAWTHGPTNADGLLEHPDGDGPGIEVVGDVNIHVEAPPNSPYRNNGTQLTVTGDRHVTVVLHEPISVSGQINESDGTPAANDTLRFKGVDGTHDFNAVVTNTTGEFDIKLIETGTYHLEYHQDDRTSSADLAYPNDGSPDIFAIDEVTATPGLSIRDTLPSAHDLNVTVVDANGTPVAGAEVRVGHHNNDAFAGAFFETNTDGMVEHLESDGPGVEVVGEVRLDVDPPDGSRLSRNHSGPFTVTSDTNVTIVLHPTVNVSGQLIEADGDPAAHDHIQWNSVERRHHEDQLTDSDGRFGTQLAENSTYEIGYKQNPPWSDNAVKFPKDGTVDIQALGFVSVGTTDITGMGERLPTGHNLTVTVVDESGAPVQDARVNFVSHEEAPAFDEVAHQHVAARTNASGDLVHPESDGPGFEVNGTVHVNVEAPEGSGLGDSHQTVNVEGERHLTITLEEEVLIRGQIEYANGSPAAATTVHAHGRDGTHDGRQDITNASGQFEVGAVENGTYNIHYHQDDFSSDTDLAFPKDGNPDIYGITQVFTGTDGIDIGNVSLPQAHLVHIEVIDESGSPVPNATVRVFHNPPHGADGGPDANLLPHGAPTNADGLLEVPDGDGPGLELVGDIGVRVIPPEGSQLIENRTRFSVTSDMNVTLVLTDGVNVSGQIRQFDGTAADGDRVKFHTISGSEQPPDVDKTTHTDVSGNYSMSVAPDRTYNVQYHQDPARRDGYVDVYAIPQVDVGATDFEVGQTTLPPAHVLEVTVVTADGTPVEDADVFVNDHNEDAWSTAHRRTDSVGEMFDPDTGLYGIEVNDSVHVRAEPPGGSGLVVNGTGLEVHHDQHLTIVLKEKVDLRGQFLEADGDPAANDTVAVFNDGPLHGQDKLTATDSSGNFSIAIGTDTTHDVQYYQADFRGDGPDSGAFPRDGSPDMVAVERVNTSGVTGEVDLESFQLPTAYTLNVSVVDASGAPVEDAIVGLEHQNADDPSDAGLGQITTNADGLMHLNVTGNRTLDPPPGIEVFGTVQVTVERPPNSSYLDRSYERVVNVSNDTEISITLQEPVNVTGNLHLADGTPANDDTIIATEAGVSPAEGGLLDSDRTSQDGEFSLTVPSNETYDISVGQIDETGNHLGERDGSVDFFALDRRNDSADADLGNVSLPAGHVVNVTVVDGSGDPVADAIVDITHVNDTSGAQITVPDHPTNEDGLMVAKAFEPLGLDRSEVPGLELRGNVTIEVRPPDDERFVDRTYERNLDVTGPRSVTITMEDRFTSVSGRVLENDSDPAVNDTLAVFVEPPSDAAGILNVGMTNATGHFNQSVLEDEPHDLQYYQTHSAAFSDAGLPANETAFPRDSSPDLYALARVNSSEPIDLGTITLPQAYLVNVTVVDESGEPVENATVDLEHFGPGGPASFNGTNPEAGLILANGTNADGMLEIQESDGPGIELTGNVTIAVEPPADDPRFVDERHVRTLTITEPRNLTFTLNETAGKATTVSLEPGTDEVAVTESTTFEIVVDFADGGVGAHTTTVTLPNGSVANITDVQLNGSPGLANVDIAPDNSSVTIDASLMDTAETGAVTIATVTVEGAASGETPVNVNVDALGDELGTDYNVTGTNNATLNVTAVPIIGDFENPPTDPDGDGLYEDVNGNGEANIVDVQAMFANRDDPNLVDHPEFFDFSGNGDVDIVDVQALFVELSS